MYFIKIVLYGKPDDDEVWGFLRENLCAEDELAAFGLLPSALLRWFGNRNDGLFERRSFGDDFAEGVALRHGPAIHFFPSLSLSFFFLFIAVRLVAVRMT